MKKRTMFLHLHLPKCGGNTFNFILWKNFRRLWEIDYGPMSSCPPHRAQDIRTLVDRRHRTKAISSHRFHAMLDYDSGDTSIKAITFVRDPVDRFISRYYWARGRSVPTARPEAKEMTLAEFAHHSLVEGHFPRERFADGQLRHLALRAEPDALNDLTDLVERGHLHLFPTDMFSDACLLLAKKYPDSFRSVSFKKRNVSKRKPVHDPDLLALIAEHNELDFELHRLARESVASELARTFEPAELARCRGALDRANRLRNQPFFELWRVARLALDRALDYRDNRRVWKPRN